MAKGLDKILAKIGENPRQTLVGRYLSLIADIPDEEERAGYALDLAETLVKFKPNDALKISFMIYQAGRHEIRALRIVIDCFEAKGRAGKVAVLKMELEKLLKEKGGAPAAVSQKKRSEPAGKSKPVAAASARKNGSLSMGQFSINEFSDVHVQGDTPDKGPSEHTRMAELDLGDFQDDASEHHPVDFLFPDHQESGVHHLPEQKSLEVKASEQLAVGRKPEPELKIAEGFFAGFTGRPGDTVLPVMPSRMIGDEEEDSGTVVSLIEFPENLRNVVAGKTVNLNDLPRVTLDKPLARDVPIQNEVPIASSIPEVRLETGNEPKLEWRTPERHSSIPKFKPRTAAPSEVFDRFFNSKRFEEAESILEHTAGDRTFDWWRSRYDRLQLLNERGYTFGLGHIAVSPLAAGQGTDVFVSRKLEDSVVAHIDSHTDSHTKPGAVSPKVAPAPAPANRELQPFSGDFRRGVMTEVLQMSDRLPQTLKELPANQSAAITPELMTRLLAMSVETEGDGKAFFELLQGLFAGDAGESVVTLIEKKSLKYRDSFWFGLYLDALLNCGYGRKVIAESVMVSEKHPTLSWLRVIWRRLPLAWDLMGIDGFKWSEDDGAREFLEKISRRGRQRLKSYNLSVHPA